MTATDKPTKQPPAALHTGTPGLVCPNCGRGQEDGPDLADGTAGVLRCEACRQWFGWTAAVTVRFTTTRKVPKGATGE
jgi:hypothetical protein